MEKVMEKVIEETLKEIKKNMGGNIDKSNRFISETEIIQHFEDKNTDKCIKSVHFSKTTPIKKLQEITFTEENENVIKEIIWYEYNKTNNKLIRTTTCDNNNIITIDDNINNKITTETYYSNGKIKERIIKDKKNNNIISTRNFNENGICTSVTVYNTEGQKTVEMEFYEDGKTVKCLHTYENGKRIKSESFDEKNNKIKEDIYHSFNDTEIKKSTIYDPQTKMIIKDVYLNGFGKIDRQVQYTYKETTTQLDTYNTNDKKTETEIFDKKNNKIEEQILDDNEQVKKITKFHSNEKKDLEIFFDRDGKIEKLNTYHENECNKERTFQNIVNFDRNEFLNLSTEERKKQLDQLIETNTKYCAEYDNGNKINETFYRENGTKEKMVEYKNDGKSIETFYRENGTKEKMVEYKNNGKSIETIIFYDTNGAEIDIVDKSKLQEYSEQGLDIKTLIVSINDKDKSIKYHKICDNTTDIKERHTCTFTYKNNKLNTMITGIGNKKYSEVIFKKDGENIEIMNEYYDNGTKSCELFVRENSKTVEKEIRYNEDSKKTTEAFIKEDGESIEKIIFYENDGKTIKEIIFYNTNAAEIDVVDKIKLQELLKDLNGSKYDIETLTMSIDEKDSSIKHYSVYDKTEEDIKYVITHKDDKKNTETFFKKDDKTGNSIKTNLGQLLLLSLECAGGGIMSNQLQNNQYQNPSK